MLHGSCLCGGVKYEIHGELRNALYCHCSVCRKAHGTAFRARAAVRAREFRFVQGKELITFYESSPGNQRGFCRICGSPIVSRFDVNPDWLGLPLGALDDDPGVKPMMHVYVGAKASWHDITDDLPQFDTLPPS
jgi:hypothetical protein